MLGVCIKYFHENYGGMLQSYATVSLLKKYNIDYELIRYTKKHTLSDSIRFIPRLLNVVLLNDKYESLKKKIGKKLHPEFARNDAVRSQAFRRFREAHFEGFSTECVGYDELKTNALRYDAVLTGSDQLWSPAGLPTNFFNLKFVDDAIRKISYASSFGVKKIPFYQKKRTAEYLKRIEYISMRENRGAEIVEELTGRTVPTVLDPVLMFDKNEWDRMVPVTDKCGIDSKYVFAYFLGCNKEYRQKVTEYAKKRGLKIVALHHLDQYVPEDENFGDMTFYDVAPDDFLNILRGAEYVFTDSFHGTCFSIIYQKKFITFNRYSESSGHSKNSRIDSLCTNLQLNDRRYRDDGNFTQMTEKEISYPEVCSRLEAIKEQSEAYLKEAFSGK